MIFVIQKLCKIIDLYYFTCAKYSLKLINHLFKLQLQYQNGIFSRLKVVYFDSLFLKHQVAYNIKF